jgi:hypothetical protein
MTLIERLDSIEFHYLMNVYSRYVELKKNIETIEKDRDFRIGVVLDDSYSDNHKEIVVGFRELTSKFNSYDFSQLDSSNLNELKSMIQTLQNKVYSTAELYKINLFIDEDLPF